MAFPSDYYGDPLKVVIRQEAQSCKGCSFEKKEKMFGIPIFTCKKGRPHGNKCRKFIPIASGQSMETGDVPSH